MQGRVQGHAGFMSRVREHDVTRRIRRRSVGKHDHRHWLRGDFLELPTYLPTPLRVPTRASSLLTRDSHRDAFNVLARLHGQSPPTDVPPKETALSRQGEPITEGDHAYTKIRGGRHEGHVRDTSIHCVFWTLLGVLVVVCVEGEW